MIDPVIGWFEMAQIINKTAAETTDINKKTWFTCYPLTQWIVFDCGTLFMAEFAKYVSKQLWSQKKTNYN